LIPLFVFHDGLEQAWAWTAQPDRPGSTWPENGLAHRAKKHAVGLGLGRKYWPDSLAGPGLGKENW
jgi:hypothetical protein